MASIDEILAQNSGIRLDIGCGEFKDEGWVGLDMRAVQGVDIVQDVEVQPWDLPDECVTIAKASHLVEHINPSKFGFINFMNEVWRILKVGSDFAIATPHGYSPGYLQDPTHCNPCNENTWRYFDPEAGGLWNIYKPKPWQIRALFWDPAGNIEVVLRKRELVSNMNGTPE